MKTIAINLYKFNELSEQAQQKAIEELWDLNVEYDWWESVYEDAGRIELIIDEFDIDRSTIGGYFKDGAEQTAHLIEKEHGNTTDTFKLAKTYLSKRDEMIESAPKDENGDFKDEWQLDSDLDELDSQFLHDLLEEYIVFLKNEYAYLTSKEAIIESIEANDYDFTIKGELY